MKRTMTAAALAIATLAPAAQAMQQELNSLTGALYNDLTRMQMDVGSMTNLTISEVNRIAQILAGGDNENEKRRMVDTILRNAAERQ